MIRPAVHAIGFLLLVQPACQKSTESAAPPVEPAERIDPVPPKEVLPPQPVPKNIKRDKLVGGCMESCERPENAIRTVIRLLLQEKGLAAVKPYFETSVLVHNGKRLGSRWAQLFTEQKLAERNTEIDEWLTGWISWVGDIVDPADKQKFEIGIKVAESNQKRYVILYEHPQLKSSSSVLARGPVWRIVLKPRGLEWLIAEIDDTIGVQ